jgi:molybdopterin/thiamine biosynthesis adenylyltransferase
MDPSWEREGAPLTARLPSFIGAEEDAAERLEDLKVGVVGCGSVGQGIGLHLARLHVKELMLVDYKRLKEESVLTHPSATPADVGRFKASFLGERCSAISPGTRVTAYDRDAADVELTAYADMNAIALASDNLLAEVEVAQRCMMLGIPLIQSSLHGETLVAQVRFVSNSSADGPCLVCGYSAGDYAALDRNTRYSCEDVGRDARARTTGPPTVSPSFLCAIAADVAMVQLLRFVLGLGVPVGSTVVEYCGFTNKCVVSPLARNPRCRADHVQYRTLGIPGNLADRTPRQLRELAGLGDGAAHDGVSFWLGKYMYGESGACRCSGSRPLGRFFIPGDGGEPCPMCGEPVRPNPFGTHRRVPADLLADGAVRPLRELGAGAAHWVVVRGPDGEGTLLRGEGGGR